jgi:hypothetical protein
MMQFYRQGGLSMDNEMTLTFLARSENEGLARIAVTSFMAQLDPTIAKQLYQKPFRMRLFMVTPIILTAL